METRDRTGLLLARRAHSLFAFRWPVPHDAGDHGSWENGSSTVFRGAQWVGNEESTDHSRPQKWTMSSEKQWEAQWMV